MLSPTTKETEEPRRLTPRTPTGQGISADPASRPPVPGAETARRRKGRVLLVEDEADLVSSLSYSLEAAGYQVRSALDGTAALQLAAAQPPDIVLLDLMLPDMSGLEVCRRIRASGQMPQPIVIMVTARGEEVDRVVGFEVGADDYLVKPFSVRELLLRMEARQRAQSMLDEQEHGVTLAAGIAPGKGRIALGNLEVDPDSHQVFVDGSEVHVSALEMRLLLNLLAVPGKVRYPRKTTAPETGRRRRLYPYGSRGRLSHRRPARPFGAAQAQPRTPPGLTATIGSWGVARGRLRAARTWRPPDVGH